MGNRIYGCDDCLSVCPWNKFAQATGEESLIARADLTAPQLAGLARLDDGAFRTMFAGSPIKRIGRGRFLRNVLIAIGNSRDASLMPAVVERLDDDDELVRGAAIWALSRLADPGRVREFSTARLSGELSSAVREEWQAALADR